MKHFTIPSLCVQIALVRCLPWWLLAGFTIFLSLFPKRIMPYCYPAPEHFPRWCQVSAQCSPCQKSSFHALCRVHCQVTDNYFIWFLSTCSQTGILYLQNCLLGTILCWLCHPFSLSGRNEWGGKRQQAQFQAAALRAELGDSPKGYIVQLELWTQSNSKSPAPRKASGQRKGTWEPLYVLSTSGRSKAHCETHQAVARVQLADCWVCSTMHFQQLLWQCCDRSITHGTTQPKARAERPDARIYIPLNCEYSLC